MAVYAFDQLPTRIRALQRGIEEGTTRIVRRVASAVHHGLVLGTPVDTGRARSNWIVTLGGTFRQVIPPYVPYPKYSQAFGQMRSERANATAALAQGSVPIRGYRYREGLVLYIQNNVPYIGRLNQGYSAQSGAYFVDGAVRAGVAVVRMTVRFVVWV